VSPFWWAVVFGGSCLVAAVVISVACLHRFALDNARDARARADR
jgi:hypothetical protein